MRKIVLGLAAAAVIAVPLAGAGSANAAVGGEDFVTNGSFGTDPANALAAGSTTDFKPANLGLPGNWQNRDQGTMYDPGTFTIASNPASLHEFWANFPGNDQMMIVNGFQSANKLVWGQDVDLRHAAPTYTLWAGQNQNVGTVTVTPEAGGTYSVKYTLSAAAVADGYKITQIHIATANDPTAIPQSNGNPTPGKFAVNKTFAAPGVTEYEATGVTAGEFVAAHADLAKTVNGVVVKTDSGWSEGTKFSGKNWATYSKYTPKVTYEFSMNATNILPDGVVGTGVPGAHLTVSLNNEQLGEIVLTGVDAGKVVTFKKTVDYSPTAKLEIRNLGTEYSGNDFAIDDIKLVQVP
jgi:hypothetical protein